MSSPTLQFVIVGADDRLLYEIDLRPSEPQAHAAGPTERTTYLNQFVMHASLDNVEEALWTTTNPFLKTIDRFNDLQVLAFTTAGNVRFLMLHNSKNSTGIMEDAARSFFNEAHDYYLRIMLNPFNDPSTRINSPKFTERIKAAARRYINL